MPAGDGESGIRKFTPLFYVSEVTCLFNNFRYQWEQEIMNYLPAIPLTRIFVMCKSKEQIHNPLILITSYDLMSRCESTLMAQKFGVIIMVNRCNMG